MRLSDLRGALVRTLDGERIGRVHEVHSDGGRIVALTCGPGSLIERLTAKTGGKRISWDSVRRIKDREILITPDAPERRPAGAASASRNRQGTRRPSGRRSKR
jgi:sporulation protein YlmC with PRC-barrel domain